MYSLLQLLQLHAAFFHWYVQRCGLRLVPAAPSQRQQEVHQVALGLIPVRRGALVKEA